MSSPPVFAVVGPTAVGKTSFALHLAEAVGGEIVNADALQVYRGLDIGTAKPSPAERRRVPHHLIDVLEPEEAFSAGEFARRARPILAEIAGRERVPILVGGSGLYLRALLEGLSPVPRDLDERGRLEARLATEGLSTLYAELAERDPATAERLAPGDTQRILRALEVVGATGVPMSEWIARRPFAADSVPAVRIGLTLPRTLLYDRIEERVRRMVDRGWAAEVATMLEEGVDAGAPAFQAIGYRQMVRHLRGDWSLEAAVEDIVRATRRYAKRQLTWFRKEKDVQWLEATTAEGSIPDLVRRWGNRTGTTAPAKSTGPTP